MAEIDFLPFATAPGANVLDQSDYAALPALQAGYVQGTALSAQVNKTWRQSSVVAAAWARFIAQQLGVDVLDDGNLVGLTGKLLSAITTTMYVDTGQGGANALICNPPTVPGGLFPNSVIWVNPANTNIGAATLNLGIGGNLPLVRLDGTPLQPGDYIAGQPFPVTYAANRFSMLLARITQELGGNIAIGINAQTGNDVTGSLTNPFATLQAAWNFVAANYYLGPHLVNFNCAGNFSAGLATIPTMDGQANYGQVTFNFAPGSTINTPGDAFVANGPKGLFTLQGPVAINAGSGGNGLRVFDNATVAIGGINFGVCGNCHILGAEGARIVVLDGAYNISGSAVAHFYLYDVARVRSGGLIAPTQTINVTGNPHFSTAFASIGALSLVSLNAAAGYNFAGLATGVRYLINNNGVAATGGGGPNFFPGDTPGVITSGGQYT